MQRTAHPYHTTLTRDQLLESGRRWFAAAVDHADADELLAVMLSSIRAARPESIRHLGEIEPTEQPQTAPPARAG